MHSKIVSYLHNIPSERVFLQVNNGCYTFNDILHLCSDFRKDFSFLAGKNCAVISEDRESLAIYLPVIDSICAALLFLPNDINDSESDFFKSASVEYIIKLANCSVVSVESTDICHCSEVRHGNSGRYILATSGTTGTPKLAAYSLESLIATTQKDIERGEEFTWGLTYDVNRFAGLQVYLQAIIAGSKLVIPSKQDGIDSIVNLYANSGVNCISGTPSFWRKVLMQPSHKSIPLRRITLGGEISNQSILTALSNSFPNASINHIYASTEAGVGFSVKDKLEGFPLSLLDNSVGKPYQLKIEKNVLWIKSNRGCSKFVKGDLEVDQDGYINTGDLVEVVGERVLFLGRDSGSINVGGNKVMPEKIEGVIEESPYVSMAYVFAKKNSVLGAIVSTDLVLTELGSGLSNRELKKELIDLCRNKLEPFEIPALFKRVDIIETNATGKIVRNKR